jgi:hypothetical protein
MDGRERRIFDGKGLGSLGPPLRSFSFRRRMRNIAPGAQVHGHHFASHLRSVDAKTNVPPTPPSPEDSPLLQLLWMIYRSSTLGG